MHTEHRTWFPFILVGLTFALIFGVLAWMQSPSGGDVEVLQVFAPSSEDYQKEISEIILGFEISKDPEVAYNELLEQRVPAEFKDLHLNLALIFGQANLDSEFDIFGELGTLRAQYNWLP